MKQAWNWTICIVAQFLPALTYCLFRVCEKFVDEPETGQERLIELFAVILFLISALLTIAALPYTLLQLVFLLLVYVTRRPKSE